MPEITPVQSDLKWALEAMRRRVKQYVRYRFYYEGRHNLCFATAKFRNAFGTLFREFADNLMPVVVDTLSDRLKVAGFTVQEDQDPAGSNATPAPQAAGSIVQQEAAAREIWRRNRMDARATQV